MRVNRLTNLALLTALALALSYLEALLPLGALFPVPGVKLGLANIVTLFALVSLDGRSAALIVAARTLLSALLFSGPSGFLYSILGGLLAVAVMWALLRWCGNRLSLGAVSVAGAAAHGAGQICAAALMMKSAAVFGYLPVLLLLSIPVGLLTGLLALLLLARLTSKCSGF